MYCILQDTLMLQICDKPAVAVSSEAGLWRGVAEGAGAKGANVGFQDCQRVCQVERCRALGGLTCSHDGSLSVCIAQADEGPHKLPCFEPRVSQRRAQDAKRRLLRRLRV